MGNSRKCQTSGASPAEPGGLQVALEAGSAESRILQAKRALFEKRSHVPIRGRRETQDLYVLPMRSDS